MLRYTRHFSPARLLQILMVFSLARPWTVLLASLATVVLSLGWAVGHLELRTSNLDLVDPDLPSVATFRAFAQEYGTPNTLVVTLGGEDETSLHAAVDQLEASLSNLEGVRAVFAHLPYDTELMLELGMEPYFTSRDRTLFFLFVQPIDPDPSAKTIARLAAGARQILNDAGLEATGIRCGLTGLPKYALDDREMIQHDLRNLSAFAFGLVLVIVLVAFSSSTRPLAAMAALIAAVAATLGAAAVYPGHLTLLSAFFVIILFGLGADYGIHIIDRIESRTAEGLTEWEAISTTLGTLAPGLATGGLTTAFAFFSFRFCGFRGFEELGMIAGVGVLLCLLSMVTVLPALLVVGAPHRERRRRPGPGRVASLVLRAQHPVVATTLALAAVLAPLFGGPVFDLGYLSFHPSGSETVRLEREMVESSDLSPLYAAFEVDSRQAVEELTAKLHLDDSVARVHSIADLDRVDFLEIEPSEEWEAFRRRFESPEGHFAVYAYPWGDLSDPAIQQEFLSNMRAIDQRVTGLPFLGDLLITRSRRALMIAGLLSSLALIFWLMIDFRDLRWALLAALPTFLGIASMEVLMRLFGIPFNPMSIMALPLVLGIAVDNGAHLVHRFLQERGDAMKALTGTSRSAVLTSLTSIAAFGSLAFTSHRGLASFAQALTVGVTATLLISVLVLPQVLGWVARRSHGELHT